MNNTCQGWLLHNVLSYRVTESVVRQRLRIFLLILVAAFLIQFSLVNKYYNDRELTIIGERTKEIRAANGYDVYHHSNDLHLKYENRIEHVKNICEMDGLTKPNNFTFLHHNYCDIEGYNISLCKVPKCGSTYWMQVINVLKSGISDIDSIVKKDRRELHIVKETCNNKLVRLSRQAMKIVLIGRDPYARIYSAYVDKSYLGFKTNNSTLKRTNNCSFVEHPFIESFQEFLQKVFDDLNERKSNSHWTPVFILCNPCQSNIFLQIKLEELSKDMNYIYSRIGFSEDLQTQIKKLSTCRIDTLTGIASTIFQKHMDTKCKNSFLIAKRLWVSFQLQGYINEKSKFPGQLADFKYTNSSEVATKLFMKLISNEMSANPLSKSEANTQRYTNLVRAYRNVHSDSILKIQHYFKMDFLLFNYSMFPPQ